MSRQNHQNQQNQQNRQGHQDHQTYRNDRAHATTAHPAHGSGARSQRGASPAPGQKSALRPARSSAYRRNKGAPRSNTWAVWLVAAFVVVGVAVWQIGSRFAEPASAMSIQLNMEGFKPGTIELRADQSVNIKLVNTDDPFHTDGGGVHEFSIPELGIDAKVDPRSSKVVTIPAAKAGTYTFYCDVCCGGKENPTMQGTLTVS